MSKRFIQTNRLALLLIILLATLLRLVAISTRPIWYDEAFAVLFAEKGLQAMLHGTLTQVGGIAADVHPLAYYLLLKGWMNVFGQSLTVVRLLSVLFGVGTVLITYVLSRSLAGERMALTAALLVALSPFQIHYAQEIRMYALLVFLLAAATMALWYGMHNGRWYWWAMFSVTIASAQYVHNLAIFYTFPLALTPVFYRNWRSVRNVILSRYSRCSAVYTLVSAIAVPIRKSATKLLDDKSQYHPPGDNFTQLHNKPAAAGCLAASRIIYHFLSSRISWMADSQGLPFENSSRQYWIMAELSGVRSDPLPVCFLSMATGIY